MAITSTYRTIVADLLQQKGNMCTAMFPYSTHPSIHHLLSQEAPTIRLRLQPLPQRVSIVPIDVDLAEHVKAGVEGRCERFDLRLSAGFLHIQRELTSMRPVRSAVFV